MGDAEETDVPSPSLSRRDALLRLLGVSGAAVAMQGPRPAAARQGGSLRNPNPEEYMELPETDPPIKYYDFPQTYKYDTEFMEKSTTTAQDGDQVKVKYTLKYKTTPIEDEAKMTFKVGAPASDGGPPIEAFSYGVKGLRAGQI